ncbi:hypothetical protein IV203_003493 [Nitzschia inconspicua]|uniref:Uncharacterized protein n=1 Tax=Nitzschia inconspicua TaxID=303405 RepID=A0A9K3L266_9STRA|nr:hypothetical protein IV203_003493 [Nitzschia inconspicua]
MGRFDVLLSLALTFSWFSSSIGQEIGVELCSCAPNTYEFTLDFALFCPPVNITVGDAVAATTCMVSPFGDPSVIDLIPVVVTSIDILELNRNLRIMMQENIAGNFSDGDTFQYTSYAALPGEIVNPEDLPRAIQVNIIGVNANDEPIINVYLITFTNNCGSYPVLFEGQSAGWTRFSDLGPPDRDLCPLVPSDAPTTTPDTPAPSPFPSSSPTDTPVIDPTPSSSPTDMPVIDPTPPPTPVPSIFSMSFSMSMDLKFGDLLDKMDGIKEDIAREFGRETIIMDKLGIRGSRVPQTRPRGKTRNLDGGPSDVECDDYPCTGADGSEDAIKNAGVDEKSSKSTKVSKDSSKSFKNEKKPKKMSKKDSDKLIKRIGDSRMLSSLFDTFGRDSEGEVEQFTYKRRR